jgi:hypothetical protein
VSTILKLNVSLKLTEFGMLDTVFVMVQFGDNPANGYKLSHPEAPEYINM